MAPDERPISEVIGDIAENVQQIARAELRLAKAELLEDVALMQSSVTRPVASIRASTMKY